MLPIKSRRGLLPLLLFITFLLATACGGTISSPIKVDYTPPFSPITFAIDANGNISIQASLSIPTMIGTFSVEADVYSNAQPNNGSLVVVIRHKQSRSLIDTEYQIQTGQDEIRVVTNGTTIVDVTQGKVFIDASKGSIQSIEVKDAHSQSTSPGSLPTLSAIPSPTPSPIPTATPTPVQPMPSRFSGTLNEDQNSTTYQVALETTKTSANGRFDGKWFALINNVEEDVFIYGVNVSFNDSNRFSQISPNKVLQLQQQYPSSGRLLWFTSTSYDVGQDIWLRCEYYGLLQSDGSVQGLWYPPGSNADGGTFQLS